MIDGAMVALGISPEGRPVPIQLTAAGLLAVSGGSGGAGNGAFVGGYTLIGIAPDGTRVPIAVDSNGVIQTSGGSGDAIAQAANLVQAGPTTGAAALPTYRSLVGADLPATITKSSTFSANGAASTPPLLLSGTIFTGGSATTTKPALLVEPTGTTSTAWSTSGTLIGANGPSAFAGHLLNLQVAGALTFAVGNDGTTYIGGGAFFGGGSSSLTASADKVTILGSGFGIGMASTLPVGWNSGATTMNGSNDLFLWRDAANTLAQRNGTTAQAFRLYNTFTDASNYEYGFQSWSANAFNLGTWKAGTGSTRPIQFWVGNTAVWGMTTAGDLAATVNVNLWTGTTALATNATAGFLGVNSCAGVPSGIPASVPTGQIPQVWDSTNKRANYYSGGAWYSITADGQAGSGPVVLKSYTVAGLPAAVQGGVAFVTDATLGAVAGLGLAPTGGGANKVPVYSDGAGWIIL